MFNFICVVGKWQGMGTTKKTFVFFIFKWQAKPRESHKKISIPFQVFAPCSQKVELKCLDMMAFSMTPHGILFHFKNNTAVLWKKNKENMKKKTKLIRMLIVTKRPHILSFLTKNVAFTTKLCCYGFTS